VSLALQVLISGLAAGGVYGLFAGGYALVYQYGALVANPDPAGSADATYEYRSAPKTAAERPLSPNDRSGFPFAAVAVVLGLGVITVAGVVAWAHS
jgi:hypothetical protein